MNVKTCSDDGGTGRAKDGKGHVVMDAYAHVLIWNETPVHILH